MSITASALRQNVYRLLDQVLETGRPLEIERKGQILRIVPDKTSARLDRLIPHPDFVRDRDDDLVDVGWSDAWDGEPELDAPEKSDG